MTSKLTREQTEDTIEGLEGLISRGIQSVYLDMALSGMRQLLAAMDGEPVATLDVQSGRSDGNKFALAFSSAAHRLPDDVYFLYRHAQPAPVVPVVPENRAITQHFDTIALEAAREIMCDVNRRHEFLGGDVQLLSRIQCRIDASCRAAMLNGGQS